MTGYTNEEKLAEVRRELRMRQAVYKMAVDEQRMSPEAAQRRMEIMRSIEDDYEKLAVGERLI